MNARNLISLRRRACLAMVASLPLDLSPSGVWAQALSAAHLPAPGRWRLSVHYGDYRRGPVIASLDYVLTLEGARYNLRTEGRAQGILSVFYSGQLTQNSTGRVSAEGLVPEAYAEKKGDRPARSVELDWSRGQVRFPDGTVCSTESGVQDRLSSILQLGLLARVRPESLVAGRVVTIPEVTWHEIEQARYRSVGDEVLELAAGVTIRTLHLQRLGPRKPDDPDIDLWLGYDRGMIPVRVRLAEPGGRVLDQMIDR